MFCCFVRKATSRMLIPIGLALSPWSMSGAAEIIRCALRASAKTTRSA